MPIQNGTISQIFGGTANRRLSEEDGLVVDLCPDCHNRPPNGAQYDETGRAIRGTGHMVLDWMPYERDGKEIPKIHPTQKPVKLLKRLIEICTDPGDVVIDPCFGSGSTARACLETGRNFYGFEINKDFYKRAKEEMIVLPENNQMSLEDYQEVFAI